MKKWLVVFAALFAAIGAYAQNLQSYVPADAMVAGSANGTAILESKIADSVRKLRLQQTMRQKQPAIFS